MTEAQKTGFLRKQESGVSGLAKPFYPISFRTDRPRFPPARGTGLDSRLRGNERFQIPACAGMTIPDSRLRGNDDWIPACAGMTIFSFVFLIFFVFAGMTI
ncbi:hypothetical protein [Neisseria meningitidis]|uniref:hypothetical protein n=1 Tax=Neisseria meningitidis TaxID=487 RepID=UPI0016418E2A|nr:hypothetical protein [Neisseria meningitidis]